MCAHKIGRNDPCPCGSGKKYKHCCYQSDMRAHTGSAEDLMQAISEQTFDSVDEANAFAADHVQRVNESGLDDFDGLSPSQMSALLYAPIDSPHAIEFVQSGVAADNAPIMILFNALATAMGEDGLRATAKGNLPRAFCQSAHSDYPGVIRNDPTLDLFKVNREADFHHLQVTRIVAEQAGLIRKYKGRFLLTKKARRLQADGGIYPMLLTTHATQFNWAYSDGFPDIEFIQQAFAFTLYLLHKHGADGHTQRFYENAFMRAFPDVVDTIESTPWLAAEDQLRHCYTLRTLVGFAGFLGLISVEQVSNNIVAPEYRITKTPLLAATVRFGLN